MSKKKKKIWGFFGKTLSCPDNLDSVNHRIIGVILDAT